jgi:single-strand DNA-binding protein
MNIVILKGNLTRDPEPKILAGDKSLTEFSIAIDESYKDAKGVKVEKVLYVECQCWGSEKADFLCRYFKKGTPILVNGKLNIESWDDKETGKKRYKTRVVVDHLEFCERKGHSADSKPSAENKADKQKPSKESSEADYDGIP